MGQSDDEKWSGSQRWWEVSNHWKSFVKTDEDLVKRTLETNEDNKKKGFSLIGAEKVQNKAEEERKKNKMKERERQRILDLSWGNQMRIQIWRDSNLIVNRMNGKWKINNQKFRMMVRKTQNTMDKTDIRPMGNHLDLFQQISRDWNQEADRLTHVARDIGATWNSYIAEARARIEAVRSFFECGVSSACTDKIKNRAGSVYAIQIEEN